jgi:hypothetical protein
MVESELTQDLVRAGKTFIGRLEESGVSPDVAFWLHSTEDDSWKLILVEVKLSSGGPKAGYSRIESVLSKHQVELEPLGLDDVVIERPNSHIVSLIRKAVRTKDKGVRFRNTVVNGTLIDDAYIHRSRKRAREPLLRHRNQT